MGMLDGFKARKAMLMQQRGDFEGAKEAYARLYEGGFISAAYMLPYRVLLLREGGEENFLKVKEILKKAEKAPDMSPQRKQELHVDYAVAQYKLGEIEKAINLLEASHKKAPCGTIYQCLGFLYIEAGDAEKALAFNREAVEYDDEDPVCLDNLAQTYYRLLNDKETAKQYFDKAHEIKESQIDTLYFLAQYDLEAGKRKDAIAKLEQAAEGRFSPLNYATKDQVLAQIQQLKNQF